MAYQKKRAETIERTIWAPGVRVVQDVTFEPFKPEDIEIGQLINAEPANLQELHGSEFQIEKAKAAVIVVRMDPNTITIPPSRQDWQIGGILCYSKICTHVGCPISLWEQQTHHLLCPCHQSTFDLGDSGVVVFGPRNVRCRSCRSPLTPRATSSPSVTSSSRPDRAILSVTRVMISKKAITDGTASRHSA